MSYFVSPVLGMSLPNAGTNQTFEIAVQNANMALIEGGFTSDRTTLGTHTTQIATINAGSARGTLADYKVATPAALQALAGMQFGDTAVMAGDGTNFSLATFQYNGSKWVVAYVVFLGAAGAMAAFVTYLALGTNTNIVLGPATGILPTGVAVYCNGTRWARVGLVAPTSVTCTGGTATINDDGSVSITGAATAFSVNGVYTSGRQHKTIITLDTTSAAGNFNSMVLRAGGVDNTAASYDSQYVQGANATASAAPTIGSTNWATDAVGSGLHYYELTLMHLAETLPKVGTFLSVDSANPLVATTSAMRVMAISHRAATAMDGFTFTSGSGTFTGSCEVIPVF